MLFNSFHSFSIDKPTKYYPPFDYYKHEIEPKYIEKMEFFEISNGKERLEFTLENDLHFEIYYNVYTKKVDEIEYTVGDFDERQDNYDPIYY